MGNEAVGLDRNGALLTATEIDRSFGKTAVLRQLSMVCQAAERILLLGANGVGKSTLLRIFAGITHPGKGSIGYRDGLRVGYLGHADMLYRGLTVAENLSFFAGLSGSTNTAVHEMIQLWGLKPYANHRIAELSRGWQVRVALARTLLGRPQLLLLDEPTASLDDAAVGALLGSIAARPEIESSIIATHDLGRLASWATRIVVLAKGTIVADSGCDGSQESRIQAIDIYRSTNR